MKKKKNSIKTRSNGQIYECLCVFVCFNAYFLSGGVKFDAVGDKSGDNCTHTLEHSENQMRTPNEREGDNDKAGQRMD